MYVFLLSALDALLVLFLLCRWAHKELVRELFYQGADYLIRNSEGQTAEDMTKVCWLTSV